MKRFRLIRGEELLAEGVVWSDGRSPHDVQTVPTGISARRNSGKKAEP